MSLHALARELREKAAHIRGGAPAAEWMPISEWIASKADELEAALAGGGEAVAWVRMKNGEIDWEEDCLYTKPGNHDADAYPPEEGFSVTPLFTHPAGAVQVTDEMVEQAYSVMRNFDCFFIFSEDTLRRLIRDWIGAAINPGGSRECL